MGVHLRNARFLPKLPARLIGDAAYDSDGLDQTLAADGIELIAPHRANRVHLTQDGRPLRRYKRRWKIERLFAWLQNSRRLVTRYERRSEPGCPARELCCESRGQDTRTRSPLVATRQW